MHSNIIANLYINVTVSVGFTEENISLNNGVTGQICLTTYDKKIHQSITLNFTLQVLDNIEGRDLHTILLSLLLCMLSTLFRLRTN